tara:strand:- start:16007 stop:16486 length:480 start_codon:yes stop_codon:yes gene_type:complete
LLAITKLKPVIKPSNSEGKIEVSTSDVISSDSRPQMNLESLEDSSNDSNSEYMQLQLRIFLVAIVLTALAVLIAATFIDFQTAISLLIGAFFGILYLRLLARGIGKLGKSSRSVSKVQLMVPVLLFFLVSRLPGLELLPALLGFLLYKPALIIQFLLKP